jgi:hypothetical protein
MAVEEIDFDNFQVEPNRAQSIRDLIQKVKNENWLGDIKTVITELGSENSSLLSGSPDSTNSPSLPGLSLEPQSRVFALTTPENSKWIFSEFNHELFIYFDNKSVLEAAPLPKGNEFAIMYVNEELLESLVNCVENLLKPIMKEAKSKKAARAASFKAKFENS